MARKAITVYHKTSGATESTAVNTYIGTTVGEFLQDRLGIEGTDDLDISVNGESASLSDLLENGDEIKATPTKHGSGN